MPIDLTGFPNYRPYTNIQPFTVRDGATYLLQLEALKDWLRDIVIPHIDSEVGDLTEEWQTLTQQLLTDWDTKMGELTLLVTDAVAGIDNKVELAEAAKVAAEAARDLAEQYASDAEAIQDTAIAGIAGNEASNTRGVLDALYGSAEALTALASEVSTRLSDETLGAAYAAKTVQETVETGRLSPAAIVAEIVTARGTVIDSNYDSLESALLATPSGSRLEVREEWSRAVPFVINKSVTVEFVNAGKITLTDNNVSAISVSADDVTIIKPVIVGLGATFGTAKGIATAGGSISDYIKNLKILNADIRDISHHAILLSFVDQFTVADSRIDNIGYSGIGTLSCKHGAIIRNHISNVIQPSGFVNSYGIFASRDHTGDIVTVNPRSEDILIDSNVVENVTLWEGVDTHGGQNIVVTNNTVLGCRTSIAIVGSPSTDGETGGYAAQNFLVANNFIDTLKTDGTGYMGIVVAGAASIIGSPDEYATGMVINNRVHNAGLQGTTNGAIHFYGTRGVLCASNQIFNAGFAGLDIYHDNQNMSVIDNTFVDVWADTASTAQVVNLRSSYNYVTFSGNKIVRGSKTATHVNERGLNISGAGNNTCIDNGGNEWFKASLLPVVGGALNYQTSVYGIAPVARAAAIASPANNVDSLKTAVDAIRTAIKNFGITN